jgi:hypothetical protein
MVHCEQPDGGSAYRSQADNVRPSPSEVVGPAVTSRVEKRSQDTGLEVNARKICSLVQITTNARNCEVSVLRSSTMLAGNHMIDLEFQIINGLRHPTVFAHSTGPTPDTFFEGTPHEPLLVCLAFLSERRALDLSIASMSATRRYSSNSARSSGSSVPVWALAES